MENIITNPGLQHLAEKILWNLDVKHLKICGLINQSCQQILDNPIFWLKKFRGLSEKNQKDWIKVLKSLNNHEKRKATISYLQWKLKNKPIKLPCYTSPTVQDDFRKKILGSCMRKESSDEDIEIVKILAPLTEHPNAPDNNGNTPIHEAAYFGNTGIVKILAPLTDNPNAPDNDGYTPIHRAAWKGHTEIVKILAPLTDNPNTPDNDGETPISSAAYFGNTEIVKILAPLVDNPNVPDKNGKTSIHLAAMNGHTEIVKILVPLTDNPNALDNDGNTPISTAVYFGHTEIVKILNAEIRKKSVRKRKRKRNA